MDDLVIIAEVEGHRASYVASILESHGLTVFIENENASNMLPNLPVGAKLRVPKDQVAKAQEALQAIPPESDDPERIELDD
jgi:hypothetical protein